MDLGISILGRSDGPIWLKIIPLDMEGNCSTDIMTTMGIFLLNAEHCGIKAGSSKGNICRREEIGNA